MFLRTAEPVKPSGDIGERLRFGQKLLFEAAAAKRVTIGRDKVIEDR
jgi:hypothetical protein